MRQTLLVRSDPLTFRSDRYLLVMHGEISKISSLVPVKRVFVDSQ